QREDAPSEAVDRVVDEAGLADRTEGRVTPGRTGEDHAKAVIGVSLRSGGRRLVAGVAVRLADEEHGQAQAEADEGDAQIERLRTQPVVGGDRSRGQRSKRDSAVTGRFVEAEREAAPGGPDEVDLHDHRG